MFSRTPLRAPLAFAALLAATGLGACHPKSLADVKHEWEGKGVHVQTSEAVDGPVTVASRLDCPEEEGALKRVDQAADGRSCRYRSDKGEVELSLMADVADSGAATLAPLRARLDAMLPGAAKGGVVNVVSEIGPDGAKHENVDMPFLHVSKEGQHSHVRVLGMTIDSDDDKSSGKPGDDDDGGVQAAKAGGADYVYVLASGTPTRDGYHAVGYVARGAKTGPLVVGVFKYRDSEHLERRSGRGDGDSDLSALIDLNAKKS